MADAGYLTIGKVVKRLQEHYPDLSVSKVRYLEDEGLLNPSSTPGGYRLYSQHDMRRLETILYLQKTRFMPLSVIKDELDHGTLLGDPAADPAPAPSAPSATAQIDTSVPPQAQPDVPVQTSAPASARNTAQAGEAQAAVPAAAPVAPVPQPQVQPQSQAQVRPALHAYIQVDDPETVAKYHPIQDMPDLLGVTVGFVQQLAEVGVISLERSPHGRDLVDGRDLAIIRLCDRLGHFGLSPRTLRQYVQTARRESGLVEQAMSPYARKGSAMGEVTDETRAQFQAALDEMIGLTDLLCDALIKRQVSTSFPQMYPDGTAY